MWPLREARRLMRKLSDLRPLRGAAFPAATLVSTGGGCREMSVVMIVNFSLGYRFDIGNDTVEGRERDSGSGESQPAVSGVWCDNGFATSGRAQLPWAGAGQGSMREGGQ